MLTPVRRREQADDVIGILASKAITELVPLGDRVPAGVSDAAG